MMASPRLFSLYDEPFWASVAARNLALQRCTQCGTMRYPPGPACPECLSPDATWDAVSGRGEVLSWTVFHRQYLPGFPAPHTVVTVQLAEGPLLVGTITPDVPDGLRVGVAVSLHYHEQLDGTVLPTFRLLKEKY